MLLLARERDSAGGYLFLFLIKRVYTYRHLPLSWKALKQSSLALLRQQQPSRLSYTVVYNGYFMDYFGMPHCESYMLPETPFLDIAARKAAIPGSGTEPVAWTYTKDVAKYVLGLVRSEAPWPAETVIVGDKLSFNEVLAIAEQVRGTLQSTVYKFDKICGMGRFCVSCR